MDTINVYLTWCVFVCVFRGGGLEGAELTIYNVRNGLLATVNSGTKGPKSVQKNTTLFGLKNGGEISSLNTRHMMTPSLC